MYRKCKLIYREKKLDKVFLEEDGIEQAMKGRMD